MTECNRKEVQENYSPQEKRILGVNRSTGLAMPLIEGSRVILLSSDECPWRFAEVELNATGPYENPDVICQNTTIGMMRANSTVRGEFKINGSVQKSVFRHKSISIIPRGDVGAWTCLDSHQTFFVSINSSLFVQLLLDSGLNESFQFPFALSVPDEYLETTMLQFFDEAESGFEGGRMYGESLLTEVAAHLLTKYNLSSRDLKTTQGGLGQSTLRKVIDTVSARYDTDIGLVELAKVANMSQYHFLRMFKKSTGVTPHQYLIQHRLKRAKELISSGETNLQAVAKRVGFFDANHLKRHFRRVYGVSPSQVFRIANNVSSDISDT